MLNLRNVILAVSILVSSSALAEEYVLMPVFHYTWKVVTTPHNGGWYSEYQCFPSNRRGKVNAGTPSVSNRCCAPGDASRIAHFSLHTAQTDGYPYCFATSEDGSVEAGQFSSPDECCAYQGR